MTYAARHLPTSHRRVNHRKGRAVLQSCVWGLILGVVIAGAILIVVENSDRSEEPPPLSLLVQQMERAARGDTSKTHAFGGALTVGVRSGGITVTAKAVPQEACVHAGWILVGKGTIAINEVIPRRVTGAVLGRLCGLERDNATITWLPANPK